MMRFDPGSQPPSRLVERLARHGPRRLLALDGGGMRGLISLQILAEIERHIQRRLGRGDDFVLADWFDYVAGTSIGAISATLIALGWRVERIAAAIREFGRVAFTRSRLHRRLHGLYDERPLADVLRREIGAETLLGGEELRTLLLIVLRNATTDSAWPVSNNPFALFNHPDRPDSNLRLPLWKLLRASTAAPLFFPPERIAVGGTEHRFVDGGGTTLGNPAFQLFLMATAEPYRLNWPVGEDRLLLVSVGTGTNISRPLGRQIYGRLGLLAGAIDLPIGLTTGSIAEQDKLCRIFGRCLAGEPLDLELGDLIGTRGPVEPKLFTYLRYNADLSREGLDNLGLGRLRREEFLRMDDWRNAAALEEIGRAAARAVRPEHFDGFLER